MGFWPFKPFIFWGPNQIIDLRPFLRGSDLFEIMMVCTRNHLPEPTMGVAETSFSSKPIQKEGSGRLTWVSTPTTSTTSRCQYLPPCQSQPHGALYIPK
ncbi:hypothetical protein PM082_011047 [Marasmius tenuissimus]|nr:hypothetical protein PM082_011047 [Marasmius tenuissimus]